MLRERIEARKWQEVEGIKRDVGEKVEKNLSLDELWGEHGRQETVA